MFAITNSNEFDFEAAYNGKVYMFPKGKAVAVGVEAATHIFAVGLDNKNDIFLRHGWFGQGTQDKGRAEGILKRFKFESVDSVQDGAVISTARSTPSTRTDGDGVSGGSPSHEVPAKRRALE
jgi:hypothetical protein